MFYRLIDKYIIHYPNVPKYHAAYEFMQGLQSCEIYHADERPIQILRGDGEESIFTIQQIAEMFPLSFSYVDPSVVMNTYRALKNKMP